MQHGFTLEERLYKTEDDEIVREGDPKAAVLYKGLGQKIPLEEAIGLGLTDGEESSAGAGDQVEELDDLTRDQLNEKAAELGIEEPEKLKKKSDVVTAIQAAQEALEAAD
ncbi:MAG TPA: hypothetical protein VFN92_13430 [Solirubrobacterales bacterium]|nr:hypothetical protein [Solirubrobacterales bacterium]